MLVIQQNCGKGYECTISVLEVELGLETSVVCIQEPFWEIEALVIQGLTYTGHPEQTIKEICVF